jgi:hypothetical protein
MAAVQRQEEAQFTANKIYMDPIFISKIILDIGAEINKGINTN